MAKFTLEQEHAQLRSFSDFVSGWLQKVTDSYHAAKESEQPRIELPLPECSFPSEVMAEYARSYKRAVRPMRPKGLQPSDLCRIGSKHDGGYVMLPPGQSGIAYSLGIDTNADWDLDMAARGFQVWQYDGSVNAPPVEHPLFHFEPLFIYGSEGTIPRENAGKSKTLSQAISDNGHAAEKSIILKMDIEGGEWSVFEHLPVDTLKMFSQVVVELHIHLTDLIRLPSYTALLNKIRRTHMPFHVHANNARKPMDFGTEKFEFLLEVSYVRRDDYPAFALCEDFYPTPLDAPCVPRFPEIQLGRW